MSGKTREAEYMVLDEYGRLLGSTPLMEQAIGAAKRRAARTGRHADVLQYTRKGLKKNRYYADGHFDRLWKKGDTCGAET